MARPSLSSSGRPVRRAVNTWVSSSVARPCAPVVEVTRPLSVNSQHPRVDGSPSPAGHKGDGPCAALRPPRGNPRKACQRAADLASLALLWQCQLTLTWTRHSRSAPMPSPTCSAAGRRPTARSTGCSPRGSAAWPTPGNCPRASGCRPSAASPRPCRCPATRWRSPTRCCATRAWPPAGRAQAPGWCRTGPPPPPCTARTGSSPGCCPPRPPTTCPSPRSTALPRSRRRWSTRLLSSMSQNGRGLPWAPDISPTGCRNCARRSPPC